MELYNKACFLASKAVTNIYSTSFSLGIRMLHKKYRLPVYGIYGFVRFADEIVDTFHDRDKAQLLEAFKADTAAAMATGLSLNPILQAYRHTAQTYKFEPELTDAFLHSMYMDLNLKKCDENEYKTYIFGSAEVVGLMCLRVFCEGNEALYAQLREPARALGSAFQKVNFLRDMKSDYDERGRVYFPGLDYRQFGKKEKSEIEKDIAADFEQGRLGILQLPSGSRFGVYVAYIYYLALFKKIQNTPPAGVLTSRIRIPDSLKICLLAKSYIKYKFKII